MFVKPVAINGVRTESLVEELQSSIEPLESLLDEIMRESLKEIYDSLDSYGSVSQRSLGNSVTRNMQSSVQALRAGQPPTPDEMDNAAVTTKLRFEAGINIDQVILAFRVSIRRIHEAFVQINSESLSKEALALGSSILWGVGDAFLLRAVTTYHQLNLDRVARDTRLRSSAFQSLLTGEDSVESAKALGIPKTSTLAVMCIRLEIGGANSDQMHEYFKRFALNGLVHEVHDNDDHLIAIVDRAPAYKAMPTVGLGPFGAVEDVASSYNDALKALRVGEALQLHGIHTLETLGWLTAVVEQKDVSELYYRRHLEELSRSEPQYDELVQTVVTWINSSSNFGVVAKVMGLHENTVRYRVNKVLKTAAVDSDSGQDLFGFLWAAHARKLFE